MRVGVHLPHIGRKVGPEAIRRAAIQPRSSALPMSGRAGTSLSRQNLSEGRLIVGAGVGWLAAEFRALGRAVRRTRHPSPGGVARMAGWCSFWQRPRRAVDASATARRPCRIFLHSSLAIAEIETACGGGRGRRPATAPRWRCGRLPPSGCPCSDKQISAASAARGTRRGSDASAPFAYTQCHQNPV
jgi:hypothetical protein